MAKTCWVHCAALLTAFVLVRSTSAQEVGYPPTRSPFRDLEYRHELTLFGGYYAAGKDPAGVAPRSGPMLGVRYDANIGGPVSLFLRASYVASERKTVDPTQPAASRDLGVKSWPLYFTDFGLSLNVTGQKSYRRMVPVVSVGIGFAGDGNRSVPEDPFRFGTVFALTYGAGLRFVPGGRFQIRLGADGYLYRLRYPSGYYVPASDTTAVVGPSQARNFWKNNAALTIGASYLFFR
jgi:hypothetical protein